MWTFSGAKVRKNNDNVNDNDNFFSFYANITRFLIVLKD